jgi:hypothetical protein
MSAQRNTEETRHLSITKCMKTQIFQHNVIQEKTDISA